MDYRYHFRVVGGKQPPRGWEHDDAAMDALLDALRGTFAHMGPVLALDLDQRALEITLSTEATDAVDGIEKVLHRLRQVILAELGPTARVERLAGAAAD